MEKNIYTKLFQKHLSNEATTAETLQLVDFINRHSEIEQWMGQSILEGKATIHKER